VVELLKRANQGLPKWLPESLATGGSPRLPWNRAGRRPCASARLGPAPASRVRDSACVPRSAAPRGAAACPDRTAVPVPVPMPPAGWGGCVQNWPFWSTFSPRSRAHADPRPYSYSDPAAPPPPLIQWLVLHCMVGKPRICLVAIYLGQTTQISLVLLLIFARLDQNIPPLQGLLVSCELSSERGMSWVMFVSIKD
jgi:hypothetical protein